VTVKNLKTGEIIEDSADVVISAKGGLNEVAWPKIKGLEEYQGKLVHSGAWDERCVRVARPHLYSTDTCQS
jgi:cation diffusion facilitator CzcD-associated flavoprotein CzcO